jgi:hypothetical protein
MHQQQVVVMLLLDGMRLDRSERVGFVDTGVEPGTAGLNQGA